MASSRDVDTAVLALLESVPDLNVWDGYVEDSDGDAKTVGAALPYVVYYSTPGYPIGDRLSGVQHRRVVQCRLVFVGQDRRQAKAAGERAEDALHGARITLGGTSRLVTRTDNTGEVRRDDTWTRPDGGPLFYGSDQYQVAISRG